MLELRREESGMMAITCYQTSCKNNEQDTIASYCAKKHIEINSNGQCTDYEEREKPTPASGDSTPAAGSFSGG